MSRGSRAWNALSASSIARRPSCRATISKPRFRGSSTPIVGSTKLEPSLRSQRIKHKPSFQRFTIEHDEMNR